jgi:hypothetical protein
VTLFHTAASFLILRCYHSSVIHPTLVNLANDSVSTNPTKLISSVSIGLHAGFCYPLVQACFGPVYIGLYFLNIFFLIFHTSLDFVPTADTSRLRSDQTGISTYFFKTWHNVNIWERLMGKSLARAYYFQVMLDIHFKNALSSRLLPNNVEMEM